MKSFFVVILGILAAIYLINPTFGVFEILPDNLPGVGNLDEAGATAILLSCLAYFGVDLSGFFDRKNNKNDSKRK